MHGTMNMKRNEEVLHGVKEEKNILHKVNRRKAKWIGHISSGNWLLKHVIGGIYGKTEVTGRRTRKHKQLLDYFRKREDNVNWERKH